MRSPIATLRREAWDLIFVLLIIKTSDDAAFIIPVQQPCGRAHTAEEENTLEAPGD